ncbi:hypothetical protein F5884DRAFT_873287 [Xylogone sp. PMI_703]|nr:hypothetical protein F5884DRAFT_873287 [Xylogone sp. PMI_703]
MRQTASRLLLLLPLQQLTSATPMPKPEWASDADHSISCGQVGDPNVDPNTRWQTAMADGAFINATNYYNDQRINKGSTQPFDRQISHFFNGHENYDCQLITSACDAGVGKCETVTSAAGWLILNSFSNFHNLWLNFYNALTAAEADLAPNIASFAATFAPPQVHDDGALKLFLDITATLFGVFNAGVGFYAGTVKALAGTPGKSIDKGSSALVAAINGGITIGKDQLPAAEQQAINVAQLGSGLSTLVNSMQSIMSQMVKDITEEGGYYDGNPFVGTQDLFANGQFLNSPLTTIDGFDLKTYFEHVMYGLLAVKAWRLTENLYPVVIWVSQDCSQENSLLTQFYPKSRSCAIPGNTLYLLGIIDDGNHSPDYLPGGTSDTLNGNSNIYGGLTIDDFAVSAFQAFQLNGNQPGYQMPFPSYNIDGAGNQVSFPFTQGVRTPGLLNIPVCDYNTFHNAWFSTDTRPGSRGPNFPCQP